MDNFLNHKMKIHKNSIFPCDCNCNYTIYKPCCMITGPTGETGPTGPTGATGPKGATGATGSPGLLNLVDGNSSAAVRGIHTPDNYTMGVNAVAFGVGAIASGTAAHSEGITTVASGAYSHAQNYDTIAQNQAQTAMGRYNVASNCANSGTQQDDALIIGNGCFAARSNALRVVFNGDVHSAAGVYTTGVDYSEMFEWQDQNPEKEDRRGFFVTLDNKYIRKATPQDEYILGVTSSSSSIVGGTFGCNWQGMYLKDEWGNIIYEWSDLQQEIPEHDPQTGNIHTRIETVHIMRPKLNPKYDATRIYQPRTERSEWSAVGLIGTLVVRDDEKCQPNGFCRPNDQGIATPSGYGYRVLDRVDTNKVLICIK